MTFLNCGRTRLLRSPLVKDPNPVHSSEISLKNFLANDDEAETHGRMATFDVK